jgi:Protein of unknown function (DUF3383)
MTQNLSISRLVSFGAVVSQQGVQAPSLSTMLLLGTSAVIDTVERIRFYSTLAEVGEDFSNTTPEYLAASLWFGQSPQPTELGIGRWVNANSAGQLVGGPLTAVNQEIATWNAITAGSLKVQVDAGAATNVTGLNFAAAANLNAVATIIQTGIQALAGVYADVTCVWNAVYENFVITSGTTGTSSIVDFLVAAGTGTDITGIMEMLSTSPGCYEAPGLAAETALAAVELLDNRFGGQWYHLNGPGFANADNEAICPYIDGDATPHFNWITTQDANCLVASNTTNIAYLLKGLDSQHAFVQYSSTTPYAAISAAGRIATVNWAGSLTAINLMYQQEPGVTPETLTDTQAAALDGFNCNYYATYASGSGVSILGSGVCPSGQFADTIVGVDGLRTQAQTNVFNALLSAITKIPQTDGGVVDLETAVEAACLQYVVNGFLAPGVWNTSGFGQLVEGQTLDKGYYVYAAPIATQSEAQRAARICPPIQVAAKLAGAVDLVSGTIFVNQ